MSGESTISAYIKRFREAAPTSSDQRKQVGTQHQFWWHDSCPDGTLHQPTGKSSALNLTERDDDLIVPDNKVGALHNNDNYGCETVSSSFDGRSEITTIQSEKSELAKSLAFENTSNMSSIDLPRISKLCDNDLDDYTERLLQKCKSIIQEYQNTAEDYLDPNKATVTASSIGSGENRTLSRCSSAESSSSVSTYEDSVHSSEGEQWFGKGTRQTGSTYAEMMPATTPDSNLSGNLLLKSSKLCDTPNLTKNSPKSGNISDKTDVMLNAFHSGDDSAISRRSSLESQFDLSTCKRYSQGLKEENNSLAPTNNASNSFQHSSTSVVNENHTKALRELELVTSSRVPIISETDRKDPCYSTEMYEHKNGNAANAQQLPSFVVDLCEEQHLPNTYREDVNSHIRQSPRTAAVESGNSLKLVEMLTNGKSVNVPNKVHTTTIHSEPAVDESVGKSIDVFPDLCLSGDSFGSVNKDKSVTTVGVSHGEEDIDARSAVLSLSPGSSVSSLVYPFTSVQAVAPSAIAPNACYEEGNNFCRQNLSVPLKSISNIHDEVGSGQPAVEVAQIATAELAQSKDTRTGTARKKGQNEVAVNDFENFNSNDVIHSNNIVVDKQFVTPYLHDRTVALLWEQLECVRTKLYDGRA